jgi:hypothetical protein
LNTTLRFCVPAVLMLLASGCMSTYRLPPGKPAASLRVAPGGVTWICANGTPQILRPARDGRASIPAGDRVTIGSNFASSNGYVTLSCSAAVSLAPETDARYYQDFESEGERCRSLIYRENEDKRVGLEFESTMGKSGASCVRR